MRNKMILAVLALTFVIIGFLLVIPKFVDEAALKQKIIQKIEEATKKTVTIGRLEVSTFPFTEVIVDQIIIDDKDQIQLDAAHLVIGTSLRSFFKDQFVIDSLEISGAKIALNYDLIAALLTERSGNNMIANKFRIKDSVLNFKSGIYSAINVKDIAVSLRDSKYKIKGTYGDKQKLGDFLLEVSGKNKNYEIYSKIDSADLQFIFDGKAVVTDSLNYSVIGKFDSEFFDSSMMVNFISQIFPKARAQISGLNLGKDTVKMSSSVELALKNGMVNCKSDDFKITSKSMDGTVSVMPEASKNSHKLLVNFKSINLDNIFKFQGDDKDYALFNPEFLKSGNLEGSIRIDSLVVNKKETKNLDMEFVSNENIFSVSKFSLNLPDDMKMSFTDLFATQNNELVGKINLCSNNLINDMAWIGYQEFLVSKDNRPVPYCIRGTFGVAPDQISIDNLVGHIAGDQFDGVWRVRFNSQNLHLLSLSFKSFDFDNYSSPKIKNALKTFLLDTNAQDYLGKYTAIRTLKDRSRLQMTFSNPKFGDEQIKNLSFQIDTEPGTFALTNFVLDSARQKFSTSLSVVSSGVNPIVTLALNGAQLDYNQASGFFAGLLDIQPETMAPKESGVIWSNKLIEPFRLDKLEGFGKIKLDNVLYHNNEIKNFDAEIKLSDKAVIVSKLKASFLEGVLDAKGSLKTSLNALELQGSYAFNNFLTEDCFTMLFGGSPFNGGRASISGSFHCAGSSEETLVNSTEGHMDFISKGSELKLVDLDNVVDIVTKNNDFSSNDVLGQLDKSMTEGSSMIYNFVGSFTIKNGVFQSKDANFSSQYVNGGVAASFDVKTMLFNSLINMLVIPKKDAMITFSTKSFGNALNHKEIKIETSYDKLTEYVKKIYNISVTEQPIQENKIEKFFDSSESAIDGK